MRRNLLVVAQAAMLFSFTTGIAPSTNAAPLASAFTYQGQLSDGASRATGLYDFSFDLYDAATLGNRVGDGIQIDGVPVSNGLFSVTLDFGANAFTGDARWLEIHVRTNLAPDAVILSARQPLRATPYSLFSLTSGALNGILPDSQLSGNIARLNTPQTFTATLSFSPPSGPPFTVSSSERVPNLNADLLASGGTRIFSDSASTVGVQLLPGDNAWSVLSDRNAKQNLEAVDCAEVLEKVAALPVTTWQLKSQPESVRHMGPMAQDFQAAFGLGASERVINTSDADGVALAAIKGLHAALKAKDQEISDLKAESSELKARLEKLERVIAHR